MRQFLHQVLLVTMRIKQAFQLRRLPKIILKKRLLINRLEAWFQNQKHQTIQTSHQHQVLNIRTIQQTQRNQVNRSFQMFQAMNHTFQIQKIQRNQVNQSNQEHL